VFGTGCAVGLAAFARILNCLLNRFHGSTLAFLTGLMAGSLKKIWPWKEVLETTIVGGQVHVLRDRNILPGELNAGFLWACILALTGFVLVLGLERISHRTQGKNG
jgi:putative membrane protein